MNIETIIYFYPADRLSSLMTAIMIRYINHRLVFSWITRNCRDHPAHPLYFVQSRLSLFLSCMFLSSFICSFFTLFFCSSLLSFLYPECLLSICHMLCTSWILRIQWWIFFDFSVPINLWEEIESHVANCDTI